MENLLDLIPIASNCRNDIFENEKYQERMEELIKLQNYNIQLAVSNLNRECMFVGCEHEEELKRLYEIKGFTFKPVSYNSSQEYICW